MRLQIRQIHSVGILAAVTIMAMVLTVAFLLWGLRAKELAHANLETNSLTEMLMDQTQQSFQGADLVLLGVQERLSNAYGRQFELDSVPSHLLLSARVSGMRQLSSIFLVNSQGTVINSSLDYPMPKYSVSDREYFKYFAQYGGKSFFIGTPVRNRINEGWTLYVARPLFDPKGKFRGVIVGAISIPQLEKMYELVKLDYERPIALYFADGTLIASLPHREKAIGLHAEELKNEVLPVKGSDIKTFQHVRIDGELEMFSIGRLAKYPLLISVTDDETRALEAWRETAVPIVSGALFVCFFTALVAVFLVRKLKSKAQLTYALSVATNLYQHTVNSVMDAIVAIDENMRIVLFNPAAEKMFGLRSREVIGRPFDMLIPERVRTRHAVHVNKFSLSQSESRTMAPQLEITGRRADGKEFPIESTISRSMIGGKMQMTAVLRDVSEHRQAEVELREVNRQLRSLATSLQSVREEERTRISRELHDELGQQLTGLKLSLSWLANRLKDGRAATPETIDEMRLLLDAAIASVRRISTELRPLILDDLGFGEAMSWQAREFAKRSELAVTLNLAAADQVQGDAQATALFRIVQESLTNVVRHANATQVEINLVLKAGQLVLTIKDNGQGIQLPARHGGIGLVSMRERAISIGAQFDIVSAPGAGTTIMVTTAISEDPLTETPHEA